MKSLQKYLALAVFVFLLTPTFSRASFDVNLKYGSKGDTVKELQDFLQNQGVYSGKVDGWFGLGTVKAVKAFQSASGLSSNGYFGKATRVKANNILAIILTPSNQAEQTVTTTQPITPNLPIGCTSTSRFSISTGESCSRLVTTVQQIQQTVQQIQQNTQQIAQNTVSSVSPSVASTQINTPTVSIKANGAEGAITVAYRAKPVITWTTKGMSDCSIKNSNGGKMTGNLDNTSGTAPWTEGTTTVQCNIFQLPNGDMVNKPTSDSVIINIDPSTVPVAVNAAPPFFTVVPNPDFNSQTVTKGMGTKIASFKVTNRDNQSARLTYFSFTFSTYISGITSSLDPTYIVSEPTKKVVFPSYIFSAMGDSKIIDVFANTSNMTGPISTSVTVGGIELGSDTPLSATSDIETATVQ